MLLENGQVKLTVVTPHTNGDTSVHVLTAWDQGTNGETAIVDAEAAGKPNKVKLGAKSTEIPPGSAGPHVLTWVVYFDKDGVVTWSETGTYTSP